jgi:hypothetical protein
VTLRILLVDAPHLGGLATSTRLPGKRLVPRASHDTFFKMTLQFERKYSTQGSGAPCHVSFGFFSGFFGIFLSRLQTDPESEPAAQSKARGLLHMECDFANRTSISAPASRQDRQFFEDLRRQHSRTLGTTREDFKIAQTSARVHSSLGMLRLLLRTFDL